MPINTHYLAIGTHFISHYKRKNKAYIHPDFIDDLDSILAELRKVQRRELTPWDRAKAKNRAVSILKDMGGNYPSMNTLLLGYSLLKKVLTLPPQTMWDIESAYNNYHMAEGTHEQELKIEDFINHLDKQVKR